MYHYIYHSNNTGRLGGYPELSFFTNILKKKKNCFGGVGVGVEPKIVCLFVCLYVCGVSLKGYFYREQIGPTGRNDPLLLL